MVNERFVHVTKPGRNESLDGADFFCVHCCDIKPCQDGDGRRAFTMSPSFWPAVGERGREKKDYEALGLEAPADTIIGTLMCLDCKGAWTLDKVTNGSRAFLFVDTDALGTPVAVGDWGGRNRWPVTHAAHTYTKLGTKYWRFRFVGPDGANWSATWDLSKQRGNDMFAKCKRDVK